MHATGSDNLNLATLEWYTTDRAWASHCTGQQNCHK